MPLKSHSGFSLVEVLVAVFVLAIGLLGVAGLQISGMKNNHTAYVRTQASSLAANLSDRMRVNTDAVIDGKYLGTMALNSTGTTRNCALGYTTAAGGIVACNASDLASDDLYRWFELAKSTIPQVSLSITCTIGAGAPITADAAGDTCPRPAKHTISVSWSEQNGAAGLINNTSSLEFQP